VRRSEKSDSPSARKGSGRGPSLSPLGGAGGETDEDTGQGSSSRGAGRGVRIPQAVGPRAKLGAPAGCQGSRDQQQQTVRIGQAHGERGGQQRPVLKLPDLEEGELEGGARHGPPPPPPPHPSWPTSTRTPLPPPGTRVARPKRRGPPRLEASHLGECMRTVRRGSAGLNRELEAGEDFSQQRG